MDAPRKIALCFILNYDHILMKERVWREWIDANADIVNVYFFYKDLHKIKSPWIRAHAIPQSFLVPTSYFHVVPAYLSLMTAALLAYPGNQWFCFLTDSCCPIVSSAAFRRLFEENHDKSILSWQPAFWNVQFHTRANLRRLPRALHLANDPWFVLCRAHAQDCLHFYQRRRGLFRTICAGGLANESIFAILLSLLGKLHDPAHVINAHTHLCDWTRMSSRTSPHVFEDHSPWNESVVKKMKLQNPYGMFLRKVARSFPDPAIRTFWSF